MKTNIFFVCLFGFYGISNFVGYLMPNPFLYKQFYFKQFSLASVHSLNVKTVLFQAIQFSVSIHFSSIWLLDKALSSATTLGQSRPGSDSNEVVLHIPLISSITGTSPSDCLVLYPGHLWGVKGA